MRGVNTNVHELLILTHYNTTTSKRQSSNERSTSKALEARQVSRTNIARARSHSPWLLSPQATCARVLSIAPPLAADTAAFKFPSMERQHSTKRAEYNWGGEDDGRRFKALQTQDRICGAKSPSQVQYDIIVQQQYSSL